MTTALEITVTAPVASFRNLLYPSVQAMLPCPPPSTVGGLLAAMVGGWQHVPPHTCAAMAFTAQGKGVDLETYHPLEAKGKKSDATPKDREFLAGVTLTLWLLDDVDLWERAVRRPVWPLRLGRSQDLASARSRRIDLRPGPGKQGSAILPVEVSTSGRQLRMPHTISLDRARVQWGTYRYASSGSSATVDSPWHTSEGQAVVPLGGLHPQAAEQETVALPQLWAKSPAEKTSPGEALTTHLLATTQALEQLHARIGAVAGLPERFWEWARLACLFHDAGKIPAGFQTMVGNPAPSQPWGQRHEIYSLGFVEHVLADLPEEDRLWIGLGVLTHHRPLAGGERSIRKEHRALTTPEQIATSFGPVEQDLATHLATWLAERAGSPTPGAVTEEMLAQATHHLLEHILKTWERGESPEEGDGLTAVLLQGAITLADHVASAHGQLLSTHPLTSTNYPSRLRAKLALEGHGTYPHQDRAEAAAGHTVVRAPTGKGKTEAALLWGTAQTRRLTTDKEATPRLFYALPYLASINAMADRLGEVLGQDQVGVVHSRAASFHLSRAACDDQDPSQVQSSKTQELQEREHASRAVAKANASRLFRELVRVTTPYQLLRGALGGTAHAATLIDTANSVFVFDELHAYEPARLGMILAMMNQWVQLGGRIGVLSATIPDQLITAITTSIGQDLELVEPEDEGAWPRRHRLHLRPEHLTSSESLREIQQSLEAGRSVAVIANNVADAWYLYDQLAPVARELHGEDAALLLHSRFKTGDRAQIEQHLQQRFGTGTRPRRPGLLVATQVVEVSLDVDLDVLHTSAAPLEALLQRFGRINRVGSLSELAPVVVHAPQYAPRGKTGPEYADKVYPAQPTELAWDILTRHQGQALDEKLFTCWLNEVYDSDWGKQWADQLDKSRRRFQDHFLSFHEPLNDNTELADSFDRMFDGVDGIDIKDRETYREDLFSRAKGEERGTGHLLASRHLIPLPHYARALGTWDRELNVLVINAVYDPNHGLKEIRAVSDTSTSGYQPGAIL